MTLLDNHLLDINTAELAPSAAPVRIVSGTPTCRELVMVDNGDVEIGVWEVTPGVFDSVKDGIGEVVQFVYGAGRIVHPNGSVSPIAPGVVVEFEEGWKGTWYIEETTRKLYTIYRAPAQA
ncbi:cupin domain-containing protein (plasmid) [Coraliomargarita sp. W4R53]